LTASTELPSSVSGGVLGVGVDRDWLKALQKFWVAYQFTKNVESLDRNSYVLLNQGEAALRGLAQDRDRARASQAFDLLAVLVAREAYPGSNVDPGLVQQSLTDLQTAVRLDPANEAAKENLELSLRVLVASRSKNRGRSAANHASNKHGGGYGEPPGEGY
jgi:hypothetical protein